jgi:phosphoenolpyruvate carboxykinase (ATP)
MVEAILSGVLRDVPFARDPIFGLEYPTTCPNVSPEILNPRETWSDPAAYDAAARDLAARFHKNFERFPRADAAIRAAGPAA